MSAAGSSSVSSPSSAPGARAAPPATRDRRLAELGVLLTVLIWSANFVVVKASLAVFGPLTFAGSRYVVAAATLFLLLRWRQGSVRPPAGQALHLLALGAVGFVVYQVLWTTGLAQIGAGDSALIVASSPVMVALLAAAVGMDRLTRPKLVGALIAFAGVALVIAGGQGVTLGTSLAGDLMTLAAAALWAAYTVAGARVLRRADPLAASSWTVAGGMLVLVPLALVEATARPPVDVTPAAVLAVLYAGALAAGISQALVFNAIRYVGPTRVTATQFLVPAGAVALGALFLAEPIGLAQVAGGAVIVAGVWLTRQPSMVPAGIRGRRSVIR